MYDLEKATNAACGGVENAPSKRNILHCRERARKSAQLHQISDVHWRLCNLILTMDKLFNESTPVPVR